MAVIWAKMDGTWGATTDEGHIWMWHNPNTEQNEEYIIDGVRQLPSTGDTVYCNGHIITYNMEIDLGSGWLRNDANDDYEIVSGGRINYQVDASMTITANCYADESMLIYTVNTSTSNTYTVTITGNCIAPANASAGVVQSSSNSNYSRRNIIVNGNVDCSRGGSLLYNSHLGTFQVNGNVIVGETSNVFHYINYVNDTNVITGKVTCVDNSTGSLIPSYLSNNVRLTIGEIDFSNGSAQIVQGTTGSNAIINITGDVKISNNLISQPVTGMITIGSDVYSDNGYWGSTIANMTINGDLTQINRTWVGTVSDTLRIDGELHLEGTARLMMSTAGLILGGNAFVGNHITPFGCISGTLTTPEDFTITYIGDTPDIICFSKYQLDNTDQYPAETDVRKDVPYAYGTKTGQLEPLSVGCTNPQDVRKDIPLANMGIVGTMVIPSASDVLEGVIFDNGTEGTLESQSTADYPAVDKVLIGTSYDHDNMTGTLEPGGDNPQEFDVRFGVLYNHNLNTGKAHIPTSIDVREGIPVDQTLGKIKIPRDSEVKKDVEFDIDSIGTMESVIETNNTINIYRKK